MIHPFATAGPFRPAADFLEDTFGGLA